jgi:hypothetical protein
MTEAELPVNSIVEGDCLEVMAAWPEGRCDLVFGPPRARRAR